MKMHLIGTAMTHNARSRTREDADFPTREETELWVALNLAQRRIYRAMDTALKSSGLPPLRWYDVLWSLERKDQAGLYAHELEKALIFEQSNLSRLLNRMIREDLVRETVCKEDRRAKVLRITAKGRRTRREMWAIYGPLIHRHLGEISDPRDQKRTASALQRLLVS